MPATVSNMTFLTEFCILTQLKVVYSFIFTTCRIIVFYVTSQIQFPVKISLRLLIACLNSAASVRRFLLMNHTKAIAKITAMTQQRQIKAMILISQHSYAGPAVVVGVLES